MKIIKVCHITTVHPSRYDIRIFEKECSSLAAAGFEVYLIVNDIFEDETKKGVHIKSLKMKAKNRLYRATKVAKAAYKKALSIDAAIYHIHDPELLKIAVKLSKKGKIVIFDSHEFTAIQIKSKPYLPRFLRGTLSSLYRKWEVKKLNKLSGLIYPCSYDGKDFFDKVHIKKEIIANYPYKGAFKNKNDVKREKKMCYVGSMSESRGLYKMVEVAGITKIPLVLVGEIEQEQLPVLLKMPGFKYVELKGKLPHDLVIEEISKCSLGLSILQRTGQYEYIDTLPTKVYEYMGLGIPCVISDFRYCKELMEKYKFGTCADPADSEEIAAAVNKLFEGDSTVEEMSKTCKNLIQKVFNWENEAEKLINFYNILLS